MASIQAFADEIFMMIVLLILSFIIGVSLTLILESIFRNFGMLTEDPNENILGILILIIMWKAFHYIYDYYSNWVKKRNK